MISDRVAPERIPNKKAKWALLVNVYGPTCPIMEYHEGDLEQVTELHHCFLHNEIKFRIMFPDVIHSVFNLIPASNIGNVTYKNWRPPALSNKQKNTYFWKWSKRWRSPLFKNYSVVGWAKELQEFFNNHPQIRDWANNPTLDHWV